MHWTLPELLALPPDEYDVLIEWLNAQHVTNDDDA